jgi:hypothetical protein
MLSLCFSCVCGGVCRRGGDGVRGCGCNGVRRRGGYGVRVRGCGCDGVRCVCGGVFRRGGDKSLGATFLEILLNPYIPPLCFCSIYGSISTLFLLPNLKKLLKLEDFLLDC